MAGGDRADLEQFRYAWLAEIGACGHQADSRIKHGIKTTDASKIGRQSKPQPDLIFDNLNGKEMCNERKRSHDCAFQSGDCEKATVTGADKSLPHSFQIAQDLLAGKSGSESVHTATVSRGVKLETPIVTNNIQPKKENLLDVFINDLTEVNEIPFFDIELPREIAIDIFNHLSALDLCRCSQVSKAWKSLADDELLWFKKCQSLGYEETSFTADKSNWKDIVKEYVMKEGKLMQNWKNRVGKIGELQYVHGGVLCSANSFKHNVVAGYTSGNVKLWQLQEDGLEMCFSPSSSALIIDESEESGTVDNYVTHVCCGQDLIVATYSQGIVDLWSISETSTMKPAVSISKPNADLSPSVCLQCGGDVVSLSYDSSIDILHHKNSDGWTTSSTIHTLDNILHTTLLPKTQTCCKSNALSSHVIASCSSNCLFINELSVGTMVSIPLAYGEIVNSMDGTSGVIVTAVSQVDFASPWSVQTYSLRLYDIETVQEKGSYFGGTSTVTCLNVMGSPRGYFVTGSLDRRVRVYDNRVQEPVITFTGHQSCITQVQMDDVKVVSGAQDGYVCVWDQRAVVKLWEMHNRHPVKYLHFQKENLVTANIPDIKHPHVHHDNDNILPRRLRGSIYVYNFSVSQDTTGIPSICTSNFDQPNQYNYNIRLMVPYDHIA